MLGPSTIESLFAEQRFRHLGTLTGRLGPEDRTDTVREADYQADRLADRWHAETNDYAEVSPDVSTVSTDAMAYVLDMLDAERASATRAEARARRWRRAYLDAKEV